MRKFSVCAVVIFLMTALLCFSSCEEKPSKKRTHDPVTMKSSVKDELIPHNFVNGECTLCGAKTIFRQEPLMGTDILTQECDQKGTVVEIHYDTRAYYAEKEHNVERIEVNKCAYVYLPYGYDAENKSVKYDVLYLLHGSGLNEGYWLGKGTYSNTTSNSAYTGGFGTENVLDKLVKEGKSKKTIIVTPCLYATNNGATVPAQGERPEYKVDNNSTNVINEYWKELKNDLMPFIAENFNTYAASGAHEDLIAARDHQGYAGLSLGSMTSYNSVAKECTDVISYIASLSGSSFGMSIKDIAAYKKENYGSYPINYWYASAGTAEDGSKGINDFVTVRDEFGLKFGSDIKNGDSAEYVLVNGTAHNYATWITALYNFMQVFFQK